MKRKNALSIALAVLSGAAILSVGSAFGAEEQITPSYPQNFDRTLTFETPVRDFAVNGDTFVFAYSTSFYVLYTNAEGERQRLPFPHTSEVSAVDYDDNGNLYFKDVTNVTYCFNGFDPTKPFDFTDAITVENYEFRDATSYSPLYVSGETVYYQRKADGKLLYTENGIDYTVGEGNFTLLKKYGDEIYAVKDNRPYKLSGSSLSDCSMKYTDFESAKKISVVDVQSKLKNLNERVGTYEITDKSYYTKINKNSLATGGYFNVESTMRANGNTTCMAVYASGTGDDDLAVVTIGSEMYITAYGNLVRQSDMQSNTDGKKYYALSEVGIYSSPFMSESTKISTLKCDKDYSVIVLERYEHAVLSDKFCKISFEDNGETKVGFVAANYLTEYDFAAEDNEGEEKGDEHIYDTNVSSVILAIVIVALVIIAVLYVALISSKKDKNKGKKQKKEREKKDERQEKSNGDEDDEE